MVEKRVKIFLFFEKQIFLHKLLSWVKVMTLKIETRVDHPLHKIRKKAQEVDKNNKKRRNKSCHLSSAVEQLFCKQ